VLGNSNQIVFADLNGNYLAKSRGRDKNWFRQNHLLMSVNKTATQNVRESSEALGRKEGVWATWVTGIVRTAILEEFIKTDIFTTSCDPYMSHTLRLIFTSHLLRDPLYVFFYII
jgi:hypothetical protein